MIIFPVIMLLGILACWVNAARLIAREGLTSNALLGTAVCLVILTCILFGFLYGQYLG